MPVVINEFEAVADSNAPPAAANDAGGGAKPKMKPAELRSPFRTIAARRARLWAH